MLQWSQQSAYGTSFPMATKAVQGAGWYFSTDQAYDLAVAYQLNRKLELSQRHHRQHELRGRLQSAEYLLRDGPRLETSARYRQPIWRSMIGVCCRRPASRSAISSRDSSTCGNYGSELEGLCFPADGTTGTALSVSMIAGVTVGM